VTTRETAVEGVAADSRLASFLRADVPADLASMTGPEWDELLRAATLHGVVPLLYRRLAGGCVAGPVAAERLGALRSGYLRSAARNLRMYRELGRVLARIRLDGLGVIPLKGAHLAEAVYGNIALRPMGDLDLLVREGDLRRVEAILLGAGYLPAECNRRVADDNCHFVYAPAGGAPIVEVHWRLIPRGHGFSIDVDGVWERSRPTVLADTPVSALCPEDLLLHLCLHTSKHLFDGAGLKPLCDIAEVVRRLGDGMDWGEAGRRCGEWGIEKCVFAAMTLAGDILGVPLPGELMEAVRHAEPDIGFMTLARERIFACGRPAGAPALSSNVARLFGSPRVADGLALLLRRLFPSAEEMSRWYPPSPDSKGIGFYYPARLRDLLLRHGRQAWRLARGDPAMRAGAARAVEIARRKAWLLSPGTATPRDAGIR
jgi:hypothetical protein